MPVESHRVLDAVQFDPALSTSGLWDFAKYSNIPRSTGISIGIIGYHEPKGGVAPTVDINVFVRLTGGSAEHIVLIGTAQSSENLINPITGDADMRLCGFELPREKGLGGQFWDVFLVTTDKLETAVATVQYRFTPGPETSTHDSTEQ